MSKKFGLIGEKLSHSFSVEIHSLLGDYEYRLYEIKRDKIKDFFENSGLDGFNVTIPYKQDVIPFCDEISDRARRIGSVNTVIRRADGSFFGDNTDYFGFSTLLGEVKETGKALILGSGGSAKTVRAVLEDRAFDPIITVSRRGKDNYTNLSRHYDATLIVNTTPVGMYPDNGKAPLSLEGFDKLKLVIDLIYNPFYTALVLDAGRRGITARGGLLMLAAQGKMACEIFTGEKIDDARSFEICDSLSLQMKNIVLVGMPGSGKSSIGRALAEKSVRAFFDADEVFYEKHGISAGDYIKNNGEKAFRLAETEILRELCKKSGCVIATGGGAVTVDENFDILRQNSIVVFTDRDTSELESHGRPLSETLGVEKLYENRIDKYISFSEHRFKVHGINETANDIYNTLFSR